MSSRCLFAVVMMSVTIALLNNRFGFLIGYLNSTLYNNSHTGIRERIDKLKSSSGVFKRRLK